MKSLVMFAVSTITKYRNYGYSSRHGTRSQKTCIFINTVRTSNRETYFLLCEVRNEIVCSLFWWNYCCKWLMLREC